MPYSHWSNSSLFYSHFYNNCCNHFESNYIDYCNYCHKSYYCNSDFLNYHHKSYCYSSCSLPCNYYHDSFCSSSEFLIHNYCHNSYYSIYFLHNNYRLSIQNIFDHSLFGYNFQYHFD